MQTRSIFSTLLRAAAAAVLAVGVLAAAPRAGQAADLTIEVDTTLDSNTAAYQACTDAPGDCSLRGAISKANADSANSYTLLLQAGATYALTIDGWMEANNATGDLDILTGMTIDGRGAQIESHTGDRALRIILGSVTLKNLTIANSHLYPGPIGGSGESGGGIYIQTNGTVRLENCTLRDNTAGSAGPGQDGSPAGPGTSAGNGGKGGSGGNGGAIYVTGSTPALILDRAMVYNNAAGSGGPGGRGGDGSADHPGGSGGSGGTAGYGGGIYASNSTVVTLIHTTVRGNRAGDAGSGGSGGRGGDNPAGTGTNGGAGGDGGWATGGGGIYASAVVIDQSLIYENRAGNAGNGGSGGAGGAGSTGGSGGAGGGGGLPGEGGGLRLSNSVANWITNSTIYANAAGLGGTGGAGGAGGAGTVTPGAAGLTGALQLDGGGGGMYLSGANPLYLNFVTITRNTGRIGAGIKNHGTLYARNSIIAANTTGDVLVINAATPFYSDGYNLFGGYFSGQAASDQVVTDPSALGLLSLAGNGGPTLTVGLSKTSEARDTAACTDRAGQVVAADQRGVSRPYGDGCDKGAFEYTLTPVRYLPLVVGR